MQMLKVRNWERFQHYKNRNPPWIKLHFEILSSTDWVALDDASRVLAIACMLIASRNDGYVPNAPAYFQRVAYLNHKPNFKPLIECGFLENTQADASSLQHNASAFQADARPETETETETEISSLRSDTRARARGTRLPSDWTPSEKNRRDAIAKGLPVADIEREAERFRDYFIAAPKGVKLDWDATWRNWVSRTCEQKGHAPPPSEESRKFVWVNEEHPSFRKAFERFQQEKGHPPVIGGSRNGSGIGFHCPADWVA